MFDDSQLNLSWLGTILKSSFGILSGWYLGKVIDDLAQIYNEKTGQKIVVSCKMIDDGTTKDKDKDKKYQPTPDEVKQREQKIMSLVVEGIPRIADQVNNLEYLIGYKEIFIE